MISKYLGACTWNVHSCPAEEQCQEKIKQSGSKIEGKGNKNGDLFFCNTNS